MPQTAEAKLFESYKLGDLTLRNRIVMAPLTRNRATAAKFLTISWWTITASAPAPG